MIQPVLRLAVFGQVLSHARDIGQVLTMPLFFASNAIYPLTMMAPWLRRIATLNPLAYLVDALRGLMVQGGQNIHGLGFDCVVLRFVFVVLVVVTVKPYPKLIQ